MTAGNRKEIAKNQFQIFQPTCQPVPAETKIRTQWGNIRVKGRLGQCHAGVLNSIILCCTEKKEMKSGRICILVDPVEVMRHSGTEEEQLNQYVDDLLSVIIELNQGKSLLCTGHLIDHIDMPEHSGKKTWIVEMGEAFCQQIALTPAHTAPFYRLLGFQQLSGNPVQPTDNGENHGSSKSRK